MSRSKSQAFDLVEGGPYSADFVEAPRRQHGLERLLIDLSASTDLEAAIRNALVEASHALGCVAAHARWEIAGKPGNEWIVSGDGSPELDELSDALARGPVAGLADDGAGGPVVRYEPLIALPESRAREAARNAGLADYASLPVLAEGRPVALLEFFLPLDPTGRGSAGDAEARKSLELLAGVLGLLASRTRMREAVRRAAEYARHQAAELDEARRTRSEDPAPPVDVPVGSLAGLYDERTGFPGPAILFDRIRQAIRRRQRSPKDQFAVLVAELDGLDRVHAQSGEGAATDILVAAGRRLSGRARPADTTALAPEGHFVLVVEGIGSIGDAVKVADRSLKELERSYPTADGDVHLEARIGVVLCGPAYDDPRVLLSDALAAARRAAGARERVQVFDQAMADLSKQSELLRADLATALKREELHLEYQPIVSLQDGRITGLETFLRWQHPQLGLVPPNQFLPIAADSELIHDIGFWVLNQVCEQINLWHVHLGSLEPPPVGINLSERQLFGENFLDKVRETLERQGIRGRQIRFDISEGDLMHGAERASEILDRLHGMGIRVAIDDFGTGFSSLSLLHDLPVNALKIDRSFVSSSREKTRKWGVAKTIVELAKVLEVDVIAEGIETREQFLTLRRAGCTQAQGCHFSGPVDGQAAEAMIRDGYPLDLEAPRH